MTASGCSGGDDAEDTAGGGTVDVVADGSVTGDVTGVAVEADTPAATVDGVEAISDLVDVSTTGEVTGEVTLSVPLTGSVAEGDIVFALTAESVGGPWEVVPAQVQGERVLITATHFSLFGAFKALLGASVDLAKATIEGVTSNLTAEANAPRCEDEGGARTDGYDITSDSGSTVYWCLGRDGQGRFVKVVNNRRYALLLSYGDGFSVREQASAGLDLAKHISRKLTLGRQVFVAPRDTVMFGVNVGEGSSSTIRTEFDGLGNNVAQFQIAFETLVAILGRFGAGPPRFAPKYTEAFLTIAGAPACADATLSGNAGSMIAKCFTFDNLRATFGFGAATLLTPIIAASSLLAFFHSQLNAFGDLLNGRDQYGITVARADTGPRADRSTRESAAAGFLAAVEAEDADRAAQFTVASRDPSVYAWALAFRAEVSDDVWGNDVHCYNEFCGWLRADPGTQFVVVATDDGFRVSHPLYPTGPRIDVIGTACVVDTTPLNVRGGPGTSWPAFATFPVDACDVEATDQTTANASGSVWRFVRRNGVEGWVADSRLSISD